MPPFSPSAKGCLPNSTNSLWPIKPCQPSVVTQGGSIRAVEGVEELPAPVAIDAPEQSALAQYTAPGTRRLLGRWTVSSVLARPAATVEVPPPGVPSAGPPAS